MSDIHSEMEEQAPHHLALFTLVPLNDEARTISQDPQNSSLAKRVRNILNQRMKTGLEVGFHIRSGSRSMIATIGRENADILTVGSRYSRCQCSFEINPNTNFFGPSAKPFLLSHPLRRVVINKETNLQLGFGGSGCNLAQFQLQWHPPTTPIQQCIQLRDVDPRRERTLDSIETAPVTQRVTRIQTTGGCGVQIRYIKQGCIGRGAFRQVSKTINVDSGEFMAMKTIEVPDIQHPGYTCLKREVSILQNTCHPNIVEFLGCQMALGNTRLEIFLKLYNGSLSTLYQEGHFDKLDHIKSVLNQLLQALDFLDTQGIVHRDIKPDNILFTVQDGVYSYVLADLGLANKTADARTTVGIPVFMAPEVQEGGKQTSKVDIWSLFVTLASFLKLSTSTVNINQLSNKVRINRASDMVNINQLLMGNNLRERLEVIAWVATQPLMSPLAAMVNRDPEQRPSAGELLDKFFKGDGRVLPQEANRRVAPIPIPTRRQTDAQTTTVLGRPAGIRKRSGQYRLPLKRA